MTILGVTFWATLEQTMKDTWKRLTGKVQRAGKASLHSGPLPGYTGALCQHHSPVQILVYCAALAGPKNIHTTDNRHYIVYLERNSLPSACINTTTTETNGRMGDSGYCSEVYGASPTSYVPARLTEWNGDSNMVTHLEPHW